MCKVKNKILFMRLVFIVSGPVYKGNFNFTQLMAKTKMSFFPQDVFIFPSGSAGKNLPAMQETRDPTLGQEDPLEKEIATHSTILVWEIPWMEEPDGLQSMESQRVGHN